jgi:tRNA 2-thiouridine synthesizing protein A
VGIPAGGDPAGGKGSTLEGIRDMRGQRCPIPIIKTNEAVVRDEVKVGDTLVVLADCPSFEKEAREWCQKLKKVPVVLRELTPDVKRAEIRIPRSRNPQMRVLPSLWPSSGASRRLAFLEHSSARVAISALAMRSLSPGPKDNSA